MRRLGLLLACQLAVAAIVLPVAQADPPGGRYIVVLNKGTDAAAAAQRHGNRYGVEKRKMYTRTISGYSAAIPASRFDDLRNDPEVAFITPVRTFRATAETSPTGVGRIGATETVVTGTGSEVAVLDTGIDKNHADLAANIAGGANCASDGAPGDYDDISASGHGTHVAGTIAAVQGNGIGVRGVAPAARLWAVRVLNFDGEGDDESILCGLDFVDARSPAKGGKIRVANMSLEAQFTDTTNCGAGVDPLHLAVCQLVTDGVAVVTAAGNGGQDGVGDDFKDIIPATYDQVITASALWDTDGNPCGLGPSVDDTFVSFSNYATLQSDANHLLGAPGVSIYSTSNTGGYVLMSGTSMAAPHVSGAAAIYLAEHPGSSPAQILAGLKANAEPVGVNFNGECPEGEVSHTNPAPGRHPEPVVRIPPAPFRVVPPANATAPVGIVFAGPVDGVNSTNLVLRLAAGGSNLQATVSYNGTNHTASLQLASPLLPGEYYQIVLAPDGSTPPTDEDGDPIPETAATFRGALFEEESTVWSGYHWRFVSNSAAYGGKLIMDRSKGAGAVFTFTGSRITWYSMRGPDQGKARVYIDGVDKGVFDNYRSSVQWRYGRTWNVSPATHTIRILVLGQNHASATNAYVSVDAFAVGSIVHKNPFVVTSWRASGSSVASGGRILLDSSRGSSADFRFRGTGINWRTVLGPDQGMAKVYIDGVYKGLFDNYAASYKGVTRSFTGLSNSFHSIRIVVAGARRAGSTNYYVNIDAWRVV